MVRPSSPSAGSSLDSPSASAASAALGRAFGRRRDIVRAFGRSFGGLALIGGVGLLGSSFFGRSLS